MLRLSAIAGTRAIGTLKVDRTWQLANLQSKLRETIWLRSASDGLHHPELVLTARISQLLEQIAVNRGEPIGDALADRRIALTGYLPEQRLDLQRGGIVADLAAGLEKVIRTVLLAKRSF